MSNIREDIKKEYGFDIDTINVIKLYGIESKDISNDDLNKKITNRRNKWIKTINGANERLAERDQKYLDQADFYEEVLRNKGLLSALFDYYENKTSSKDDIGAARSYFTLVSQVRKNIGKADVDFFFDYYPDERVKRKQILEMLEKEFHVKVGKKAGEETDQKKDEKDSKEEKKDKSDERLVVNLFQKKTVLEIKNGIDSCAKAENIEQVCMDYPKVKEGMYNFLDLDSHDTCQEFSTDVNINRNEVYSRRQDKGHDYDILVDFYNNMSDISQGKDVEDNFSEFKTLVKYPAMLPYMYEAEAVNGKSLDSFFQLASKDYDFYDLDDFLTSYFLPVYSNFNIDISDAKDIIKKSGANDRLFAKLNKIVGFRTKLRVPANLNMLHWLTYWPVVLLFLIVECVQAFTRAAKRSYIANFFILFVAELFVLPMFFNVESILTLIWPPYMIEYFGDIIGYGIKINVFTFIPLFALSLVTMALKYFLPALFLSLLLYHGGRGFYKKFDWKGMERTFTKSFKALASRTESDYVQMKDAALSKYIGGAVVNIICLVFLIIWAIL